jgi:hypothetical protein
MSEEPVSLQNPGLNRAGCHAARHLHGNIGAAEVDMKDPESERHCQRVNIGETKASNSVRSANSVVGLHRSR